MQICGSSVASVAAGTSFQVLGPVCWPQLDLKMAVRVLWGGLSLLRVLWCLLPQTGYVHPDEFFQSPEVMAGPSPTPLRDSSSRGCWCWYPPM
ncbi:PIGZ isoform 3 [Pan troglodytes]|uniref:PIGZ isoform 3 n=1 Tax=Pan troglodytes TaxID=9598 RepID=A0A2J8JNA4_PANTR|nr:PIGZ isoform 3 [Pan troglodytes]